MSETPPALYVVRETRKPFAIARYFFGTRKTANPRLPKAIWTPKESRAAKMTVDDANIVRRRYGGEALPASSIGEQK